MIGEGKMNLRDICDKCYGKGIIEDEIDEEIINSFDVSSNNSFEIENNISQNVNLISTVKKRGRPRRSLDGISER